MLTVKKFLLRSAYFDVKREKQTFTAHIRYFAFAARAEVFEKQGMAAVKPEADVYYF